MGMFVFLCVCVCMCVCEGPAEADPSLCAPDSSIMKVSAVQLAESDSFYGIPSQGRTDTASSPFNSAPIPAERRLWATKWLSQSQGGHVKRTLQHFGKYLFSVSTQRGDQYQLGPL